MLNDTIKVYNIVYQKHFKRNIKRTCILMYERYVKGILYIYIQGSAMLIGTFRYVLKVSSRHTKVIFKVK